MSTALLPAAAAWSHQGLRSGFETLFLHRRRDGLVLEGCTVAVEDGSPWTVRYEIVVDNDWVTRSATISSLTGDGIRTTALQTDGQGHWRVDGEPAAFLDGCFDIDLEASAVTNTLPIHRLGLAVGERHSPAAAYVRAATLEVQRLEQTYERLETCSDLSRYSYEAPLFDVTAELTVDADGFIADYPSLATRTL